MKINSTSCAKTSAYDFDRGIARRIILPGEITGIKTFYGELRVGIANKYLPEQEVQRQLIFTDGSGTLMQDGLTLEIDELALFVPDLNSEFLIASGKDNLCYLELMVLLNDDDLKNGGY